jgi:hypothetical protein
VPAHRDIAKKIVCEFIFDCSVNFLHPHS